MSYDETPGQGALYRLESDGTVSEVLSAVTTSNGLGWSPDGATMYYVDTGRGTLDVLRHDPQRGTVEDRRTLVSLVGEQGLPDGLAVDAEGHLWLALWDGGCARRYSPSGELEMVVYLPASRVTSVAFGGPDLTDLYITTAREGLDEERLRTEPLAGSVFRCRPGPAGLTRATFAG
jgi:sugar lactone lactonase YvrE